MLPVISSMIQFLGKRCMRNSYQWFPLVSGGLVGWLAFHLVLFCRDEAWILLYLFFPLTFQTSAVALWATALHRAAGPALRSLPAVSVWSPSLCALICSSSLCTSKYCPFFMDHLKRQQFHEDFSNSSE